MAIHASAPYRMLDIGSWTDTPFAEHGMALNCAIEPGVRVTLEARARDHASVWLRTTPAPYGTFDVLRLAARYFAVDGLAVWVESPWVTGSGVGAGAAIAVALTGALARYAGQQHTPHQLACIAHRLYSEALGTPCGMQSFMAAALGSIALYRVEPYPRVFTQPLALPAHGLGELERRLLLVHTGRMPRHNPYRELARRCRQGDRVTRAVLWQLRALPQCAYLALRQRDDAALALVMAEQQALQRQLIPALLSPEVQRIAAVARARGALAEKVNGAGGSVTVLCPPHARDAVMDALREIGYAATPVRLATGGVHVWQDATPAPVSDRRYAAGGV